MHLRRLGLVLALGSGCGPELPFTWEVVDILDLGLEVSVADLGPLSDPGEPLGRRFFDAMPLDDVTVTPVVVDVDGPVDPRALNFAWFACPATSCDLSTQATCPDDVTLELNASMPCRLPEGPSARFRYADIFTDAESEELAYGSGLSFVAIGGRGPEQSPQRCLDRLLSGDDLGSCLVMESLAPSGSTPELLDLLESRGFPPVFVDSTQRDTLPPRNRAPAVEEVAVVAADGTSTLIARGDTITATAGTSFFVEWTPADGDRDEYSVAGNDGTILTSSDNLSARWWTTEPAQSFEFEFSQTAVRWTVGRVPGRYWLYVVVRDDRGAASSAAFPVEVVR